MKVAPYLVFNGNCEEAFKAYVDILGAELIVLMLFSDMPQPSGDEPAFEVPEDHKQRVMHAQLKLGDSVIMASDNAPGRPPVVIDGISVQTAWDTPEEGRRVFEALAEGGEITMPYEATFWARGFGTCRDRFGVPWMVNCD